MNTKLFASNKLLLSMLFIFLSFSASAAEPLKFVDINDPHHIVERLSDDSWQEHFGDGRTNYYSVWWLNGGVGPRIGIRDERYNVDMFLDLSKDEQTIESRANNTNENHSFVVRLAHNHSSQSGCADYVQYHIAWDYNGSKKWAPNNLHDLCEGA